MLSKIKLPSTPLRYFAETIELSAVRGKRHFKLLVPDMTQRISRPSPAVRPRRENTRWQSTNAHLTQPEPLSPNFRSLSAPPLPP